MRNRAQLLADAEQILRNQNFSREDSARVEALINLANAEALTPAQVLERNRQLRGIPATTVQPAKPELRNFFAGRMVEGPEFERGAGTTIMRSYTALNEGTNTAGGYTVPVDFYAEVLERLKAYDQIFDSSTWIVTKDGRKLQYPTDDDVSTNAATVVENAAVTQGPNPVFAQIQFPQASLWSTGQLLYSLQLAQDSGVDLTEFFRTIFARRFARGIGAQLVTTLLANATTGVTTASNSAIVEGEVYNMFDSVDAAYAQAPKAGWLMNLATLVAIWKIRTSGGQVSFPVLFDDAGHPLLLGKPVFISPSFPSIGASANVAAFGDLSRFLVRAVKDSFETIVYREIYMVNHQLGTQAFWRLDGAWGGASSGDAPITLLVMHS